MRVWIKPIFCRALYHPLRCNFLTVHHYCHIRYYPVFCGKWVMSPPDWRFLHSLHAGTQQWKYFWKGKLFKQISEPNWGGGGWLIRTDITNTQTPNKGTEIWFYSTCLRNSPHRESAAPQLRATVSAVCSNSQLPFCCICIFNIILQTLWASIGHTQWQHFDVRTLLIIYRVSVCQSTSKKHGQCKYIPKFMALTVTVSSPLCIYQNSVGTESFPEVLCFNADFLDDGRIPSTGHFQN